MCSMRSRHSAGSEAKQMNRLHITWLLPNRKLGSMLCHFSPTNRASQERKMNIRTAATGLSLLLFGRLRSHSKPPAPRIRPRGPVPRPKRRALWAMARPSVDYSSPRAKGRKIFGGLVPYGEVWRLSERATTFVVNWTSPWGTLQSCGSYTLFACPTDKWTLSSAKKPASGAPVLRAGFRSRARGMKLHVALHPMGFTITFDKTGPAVHTRRMGEDSRVGGHH